MAFYLSIVLFTFIMFVTSFYKNRHSMSIRFLFGIFIGWMVCIGCLVLYLSKHSYYWKEVKNIFYINKTIWNFLILKLDISLEMLIRAINIGVCLVYYCMACFGIAFTSKENKVNNKKYMLLAISPVLQILFFDPITQKFLQNYTKDSLQIGFEDYTMMCDYFIFIFKMINFAYCGVMIAKLINHYIAHPKIKFLKKYTLFNIVCISPITVMFYYLFRWYPTVFVKITMKKDYCNFLIPDFKIDILNNKGYYLIFLVACIALMIYICMYRTIENYYKTDQVKINLSIDTASLGVNTFTHAIKNHIQGIKTETEYLKKKYGENEEIKESTELILQSCGFCFNSIENANKQLKNINLNLKLTEMNKAVEKTLAKFPELVRTGELVYVSNEKARAYLDQEAFTEVLTNLVINALDAMSGNEKRYIEISVKEQGHWAIIEVKDNGKGIESENLDKIFTPFFSTKSSVNNWGVGLAFCYKVITAHDGKIMVESEVDKGTVFSIVLPAV